MPDSVHVLPKEIVHSCLPKLRPGPYNTVHDSTQSLEYQGKLVYWSNFESEVRQSSETQHWSNHILGHRPTSDSIGRFDLSREQYACGDEYSIQGRFGQNIGQSMTAVFGSLGINVLFGDYKTSSDRQIGGKVPDFALITQDGTLLAVGEGKTPWVHSIEEDVTREVKLRHILGQIARYMIMSHSKFGFLTTYEHTFFLKLESDKKSGEPILWHSNPIDSYSEYATVSSTEATKPKNYHNKVTTRECFLFIAKRIALDPRDPSRHRVEVVGGYSQYVRKRPKARSTTEPKVQFVYISDNKSIPPPAVQHLPAVPSTSQSGRGVRSPNTSPNRDPRREPTKSREGSQSGLEARTSRLGLRSQSKPPARPISPRSNQDGYVVVYRDEERGCYYFDGDDGLRVQINLKQDKKGNLFFDYNGKTYQAKLDKGKGKQR